jgi:hypothetical protein
MTDKMISASECQQTIVTVVEAVGVAQQTFELGNKDGLAELVEGSLILLVDGLDNAQNNGFLQHG